MTLIERIKGWFNTNPSGDSSGNADIDVTVDTAVNSIDANAGNDSNDSGPDDSGLGGGDFGD